MTEKLQKILAQTGLGSRREMERWITAGRIQVNDKIATLGDRVDQQARIKVDGKPIALPAHPVRQPAVLMYHKPESEMCTRHDPEGRATVFDRLPAPPSGRWIMVGRLDYRTWLTAVHQRWDAGQSINASFFTLTTRVCCTDFW